MNTWHSDQYRSLCSCGCALLRSAHTLKRASARCPGVTTLFRTAGSITLPCDLDLSARMLNVLSHACACFYLHTREHSTKSRLMQCACPYVRATLDQSIVHCTSRIEQDRECGTNITNLSVSALQATPHIVGLKPIVLKHRLTGCQSSNNNNPCSIVSHHGSFGSIVVMFCVSVPVLSEHNVSIPASSSTRDFFPD